MTILFCNVGWMLEYKGYGKERPERGGAFNEDQIGHEVFNFDSLDGYVYGYVRSPGQIHIEKLGASSKDNQLDNVTVVWLAGPPGGGTVVIGWYLNATVFRTPQPIPEPDKKRKKLGMKYYRIRARSEDAILLSVDQRRQFPVPRGKNGIGQSNVWYAKKPENQATVQSVLKLIEDGGYLHPIPDIDDNAREGNSVTEGNVRFSSHKRRERNQEIIKLKKDHVLKQNKRLACEVCGFDFHAVYGEHGQDFCEVHHVIPLSKADSVVETRLEDLAIVCSNCHRIIHRSDPILTINQLSKIIKSNQQ